MPHALPRPARAALTLAAVLLALVVTAQPAHASLLLGRRNYVPAMQWTAADGSHMTVNLQASIEAFDGGGCRPFIIARSYRNGDPWPVIWYWGRPRIYLWNGDVKKSWTDVQAYGSDVKLGGATAEDVYRPSVTVNIYGGGGYFAARNVTASNLTGWHYKHPSSEIIAVAPGC